LKKILKYIVFSFTLYLNGQITSEKINSSYLNEQRYVDIYLPDNFSENIIKTPLIVLLEGNELFDIVVSNVKYLSKIGYMPPAVVLGIRQDKLNQVYKDCEVNKNQGYLTDFSQNFMNFIVSEVIALISKKYGDPFLKIIIGKNYSANFINHFIFSPNPIFSTYISITPEFNTSLIEPLKNSFENNNSSMNYYVSNSTNLKSSQKKSISLLIDLLKEMKNEKINIIIDQFSNPDEFSSPAYSIPMALEKIFKIYQPISPSEYRTKLLSNENPTHVYLTEKYLEIFQKLKIRKKVILNDIAAIFEAAKRKNDIESIFVLADICINQYPEKMIGHYFNGIGHELINENKKALKHYEKAYTYEPIDFITKELILSKIESLK
jgi:predicted alpha/beta superfamily hydrolase